MTQLVLKPRTDAQIVACHPVLAELRPHVPRRGFLARIRRQQSLGYQLVCARDQGAVVAVAGYRLLENLAWGRFLYVDDLVTAAQARSQGHGQRLLRWLIDEARRLQCHELHLDSGVQRFGAHRFYLASRLDITCHHFALKLKPES